MPVAVGRYCFHLSLGVNHPTRRPRPPAKRVGPCHVYDLDLIRHMTDREGGGEVLRGLNSNGME